MTERARQLQAERVISDRLREDCVALWRRLEAALELARHQLEQHAVQAPPTGVCCCRLCASTRIALAMPTAAVQLQLLEEVGR